MSVGISPPGTVPYVGNNFTLSCTIVLNGGITDSDVMVTNRWTKNGTVFSGVPGRVTFPPEQKTTSSVFIRTVMFSPLSFSMDNGTYACEVTLTPIRAQFVNSPSMSQSMSLTVRGKIRRDATPHTFAICSNYLCMWVVTHSLNLPPGWPSLKPRPDWTNRKCAESGCYCVHNTVNESEKSQWLIEQQQEHVLVLSYSGITKASN